MKTINEQIDPGFISQAKKLTKISQFLRPILPTECFSHVQVANIRQNILMLITDSPVWTTRLRQLSPQILQYIHENNQKFEACLNIPRQNGSPSSESNTRNYQTIHHIQISTRYHKKHTNQNSSFSNKSTHQPSISKKTAELLSQSADSIKHPQLKNALLRLARHKDSSSDI